MKSYGRDLVKYALIGCLMVILLVVLYQFWLKTAC